MSERAIALHRSGRFGSHVLVVLVDGDGCEDPGVYLQMDEHRPEEVRWSIATGIRFSAEWEKELPAEWAAVGPLLAALEDLASTLDG